MSFNDPDNGDIEDEWNEGDEESPPDKRFYSGTRDIPDDVYLAAHNALNTDGEWCPYNNVVAAVCRAIMSAVAKALAER